MFDSRVVSVVPRTDKEEKATVMMAKKEAR
jgi:hypothetical protein